MVRNDLKILRLTKNLKISDVATKIGVTKSMMYQIEGGYKTPSPKNAIKLAQLYNCTLEDIFLQKNSTKS